MFFLMMGTVLLIGQTFIFMDQQNVFRFLLDSQNLESRNSLLSSIETLIAEELALRNSRFSVNSRFYQCLYAVPTPCDDTVTFDMVLFSPNPPVIYPGGAWPVAPAGISIIAGGMISNPVFYTRAGGICPISTLTAPTGLCPLQAIIRFRPVCGGTLSVPEDSITPGPCPGRATGFDITIGVGIEFRGELKFKNDTSKTGDARIYRIKSITLLN